MSEQAIDRIGRIHLTWKRHVAHNLMPHGITPKQIFVLRELRARRVLTPSEIASMLYADRPTVTSMLATLERERWIKRRRDPDNGKRVLVEISPAGLAKLESVPEALWRSGRTRFDPEAALTPTERSTLHRLLDKLEHALAEA
jgi:DNA-binding MarR family transcriptional regulator